MTGPPRGRHSRTDAQVHEPRQGVAVTWVAPWGLPPPSSRESVPQFTRLMKAGLHRVHSWTSEHCGHSFLL